MLTEDKEHQADLPQKNPQHPGYTSLSAPAWKHWLYKLEHFGTLIWQKTLIVLLLFDSAHGLYASFTFLFFRYPEFDIKLQQSAISPEEVRLVIAQAIGTMIATLIGFALAIRLSKEQEKAIRYIELAIGTSVIIWHDEFVSYLQNYDYSKLIEAIQYVFGLPPLW
ncbi:MAG: hypothetical protein WDZ94_04200 [Patescibacteria group bacterium]